MHFIASWQLPHERGPHSSPSHHPCSKAVNAIMPVLKAFQSCMTLAPVKYPSMQGGSAQKVFLLQVSGICKSMDFTNWGYNTELENLSFTGYLRAHHARLHMLCYRGEISFVSAWAWKIYYKQFNSKKNLDTFSVLFLCVSQNPKQNSTSKNKLREEKTQKIKKNQK